MVLVWGEGGGVLSMRYSKTLSIASVVQCVNEWIDGCSVKLQWNDNDRGKNRHNRRKISPSATLSATNPTRNYLAMEYLSGQWPTANRQNHETDRYRLRERESPVRHYQHLPSLFFSVEVQVKYSFQKMAPIYQSTRRHDSYGHNTNCHRDKYIWSHTQFLYLKFNCGKCKSKLSLNTPWGRMGKCRHSCIYS